ncbi:hypothetical protein [Nostoc sp.]|uniref:hypothetical protein n=1 Tax=Nostoc sp. TaxID=1180 RepID=UPI002FF8BFF5
MLVNYPEAACDRLQNLQRAIARPFHPLWFVKKSDRQNSTVRSLYSSSVVL